MGKHTETPWTSKHPVYYSDDAEHILAPMPGQEGMVIASYVLPANAAYIVKCVNSHEALVEACKEALDFIDEYMGDYVKDKTIKQIEEALKLAGGV